MAYDIGDSPMNLLTEAFVQQRPFISRPLAQSESSRCTGAARVLSSADPTAWTSDESLRGTLSWSEILQFLLYQFIT